MERQRRRPTEITAFMKSLFSKVKILRGKKKEEEHSEGWSFIQKKNKVGNLQKDNKAEFITAKCLAGGFRCCNALATHVHT